MDYANGTAMDDLTTSYPMVSVYLNYQCHQGTTLVGWLLLLQICLLVLMESPYPLIPRAQPIGGVMMNPNQDEFDNGGRGLAYSLFSLNLLR